MVQERALGPFRCPKCGTATSADNKFCSTCGESLEKECHECGATWRHMYDYAFCPVCGSKTKSKRM